MGKSYTIRMKRAIACASREAYELVKDVERFPEFMSNVVSVRLIESGEGRKVAEWETRLDDAPLDWVEEGVYDDAGQMVRFRRTPPGSGADVTPQIAVAEGEGATPDRFPAYR